MRKFYRNHVGADRIIHRSMGGIALTVALLVGLSGCHASVTRSTPPEHAPAAAAHPPEDPSSDWHGLLIVPFGTVLKDVPLPLHEVLMFHDEAHGNTAAESADCHAADAPGPRFVGHTPQKYLLCFKQDRLARIVAVVHLPKAQASDVFATLCSRWLSATPAGETPAIAPQADACEGHDGTIHFSARLETNPDDTDGSPTEVALSMVLDSVPK